MKNILIYISILIVSFCFMFFFQEYYTAAAFIVLTIMPFVLVGINIFAARKISVRMKFASINCLPGDKVKISVMIENKTFFPVQKAMILLRFIDSVGAVSVRRIYTNVPARQDKEVELQFTSETALGGYVTIMKVKCYDILGFFGISARIMNNMKTTFFGFFPNAFECNVIPKANNIAGIEETEIYSQVRPGHDRSEIFNIREYVPGDMIKDIHWKLSSKRDEILVKEFSLPLETGLKIVLDTVVDEQNDDRYRLLSKYYEVARSIMETLLGMSFTFSVIVYNEVQGAFDEYEVANRENAHAIINLLLRQLPFRNNSVRLPYKDKSYIADKLSGDILYISCGADEKFLEYIANLPSIEDIHMIYVGKRDRHAEAAYKCAAGLNCDFVSIGIDESVADMKCLEL